MSDQDTSGQVIDLAEARVRAGDHLVRGTAADGMVRAFGVTARQTVQTAMDDHHASPLVTAALGRLLMGGLMMGAMLKGEDELVTLIVRGDGPIGGLTVTANTKGQVKGYANHNNIWLAHNAKDKLDVGGGIGAGTLTVIRDRKGAEPYASEVDLLTGEIGDDLTNYFATSDQIPTSVGVGVLVGPQSNVRQAGGFIVQLMPGCEDWVIDRIEANLKQMDSITNLLEEGLTISDVVNRALDGLDYDELDASPVEFACDCSKERMERAAVALGADTLREMVDAGETADVCCQFCGKHYELTPDDLSRVLERATS